MKTYQALSQKLTAIDNCKKSGNIEWMAKHDDAINAIMDNAPSGSGIDNGTTFLKSESNRNKLVFSLGFHHINENGMYNGWTQHKAIVTPDLAFGITLKITGIDKTGIKDYLSDVVYEWLNEETDK